MMKMQVVTAAVVCMMCLPASAGVIRDNFNDGERASFWKQQEDVVQVSERDRKLRFRTGDSPGRERTAYYSSKGWELRGDKSWTMSFDYSLEGVGEMEGSDTVSIGMGAEVTNDDDGNGLFVFIVKSSDGLFVVLEVEEDNEIEVREVAEIGDASGKLTIKYVRSSNKLKVTVNGNDEIVDNDFLSNRNESIKVRIDVGAGRDGRVAFGWDDVWIDNFKLRGKILD